MITISISGSHSVGKTTLINSLTDCNCKDISVISEVARILLNKGFRLNKDITEWGVINYMQQYLFLERNTKNKVVISDRSLIDLLAYLITNQSTKIRKSYIELVREVIFLEKQRFTHYLYIPIEFPLEIDNVRPSDIEYQKRVDITLIELFDKLQITPITIKGSFQERKEKVLKIISCADK